MYLSKGYVKNCNSYYDKYSGLLFIPHVYGIYIHHIYLIYSSSLFWALIFFLWKEDNLYKRDPVKKTQNNKKPQEIIYSVYYNEDLTKIKPKSVAGVAGTSNLYYPITVSILISVQCRYKYPKCFELSLLFLQRKLCQ